MNIAIGLVRGPAGDQVVAVTETRLYVLSILKTLHLAAVASAAPLASRGDLATDLRGVLEGGEAALDRIIELIGWAEAVGLEPGSGPERAWHDLAEVAKLDVAAGATVQFQAPVSSDTKVVCLGGVFPSHMAATGGVLDDHVDIFYKLNQNVVGPWQPILFPRPHTGRMVGGTELALVIGTPGRYFARENAWDHVWGYSILNDVTLRDQEQANGKVFETSAPIGPFLVPKRQVPDPHDLRLRMRINGRQVQDGTTADMGFDMAESVSKVSFFQTLRPGDIIATGDLGSPDGLKPGDVVEAEVQDVGVLVNPIGIG